jgi:tetratricopeptide (TPR) repeat protein
VLFCFTLLAVAAVSVAAQESGGVTERSAASESRPSFEELRSRLSAEEMPAERRLDLLDNAVDRAPTVSVAIELIREQRELLTGENAARAAAAEAELHALRGNLEQAAVVYAEAASTAGNRGRAATYRFEEAALRLELGESEAARALAEAAVAGARNPTVQRRAALVGARALAAEGRLEEAFERARALSEAEHAPTLEPDTLLFLNRVSRRLDRPDEAERAQRLLAELYPESPELMLLRGGSNVVEMPRPSTVLGFEATSPTSVSVPDSEHEGTSAADRTGDGAGGDEGDAGDDPRGVQVGSFRSTENARDMQRRMGEAGFTAEISDSADGSYHRVVVPVDGAREAERLILRLKEQGFEGFLVF